MIGSDTVRANDGGDYTLLERIMRKKDIHHVAELVKNSELHRTLGLWNLVSLGVGFVIGAGIFVITGQAAAMYAGPALTLSFVLCVIPCASTGLSYGELSSMIPVSGSAYSFACLALGELPAWIVGMCLALETLVTAAAVSVGWSATVQALLHEANVYVPQLLSRAPFMLNDDGEIVMSGALINLPAVVFIGCLTMLLCRGIKESTTFNNGAVVTKVTVLVIFVVYGIVFALGNPQTFEDHLTPYVPPNKGTFGKFGWSGVIRGASVVFFACFGFDGMCSYAQECVEPQRDLPLAMMITIAISTTLYVAVTTVLTGMVDYRLLNVESPVIDALVMIDAAPWFRYIVEVGAIAGITSATLVALMSMPRLMLIVAQDGLLPPFLGKVHDVRKTPQNATITAGILCMVCCGLLPLSILGELVSFGTLAAFTAVNISAWRLRHTHPHQHRAFVAPGFPITPMIGVLSCGAQLLALPYQTWRNYFFCLSAAIAFYFAYGIKHSKLSDPHHSDFVLEEEERHEESAWNLRDATVVKGMGGVMMKVTGKA